MNAVRSQSLSQKTESTDRKPWETPQIKVFPVNETESDFIAVTDGTSFFS